LPGNPGGPGRPRRATEQRYLEATIYACSVDDRGEVVGKAVEQAKAGDAKARDFLARHLLGGDPLMLGELVEELREELRRVTAYAN
jgi:hypothetical protein